MRKFLLAGVALTALLGGAASAADLAVKARPMPAPVFTWTGFYIGAHLGGGWGTKEWDAVSMQFGTTAAGFVPLSGRDVTGTHTVNGFLGGVQGGFNWQVGPTVWGVEAQWSGADVKGHGACFSEVGPGAAFDLDSRCDTKVRSIGTIAARFGLAWDHTLVYVKGGGGWANDRFNLHSSFNPNFFPNAVNSYGEITDTRWGGMVGAGVEQAIGGGWSAKVEYNYLHLGTKTYTFAGSFIPVGLPATPISFTTDITQNLHLIKFGINYRFGWGYGGVMAAY
jgi:outer membrane immunogenic protein